MTGSTYSRTARKRPTSRPSGIAKAAAIVKPEIARAKLDEQMLVDVGAVEPALLVVQRQRVEDGARDRERRRQDLLQVIGDRHDLPEHQHGGDADGAANDLADAARVAPARAP